MKNSRRTLGATIAAAALAAMLPVAAFAQDGASQPDPAAASQTISAPDSTDSVDANPTSQSTVDASSVDVVPVDVSPSLASQSDQVDRLTALGFINKDEISVAQVDASDAADYGWLPDRFQSAMDQVMIASSDDSPPMSLRAYLENNSVDPSTVVGVTVLDNTVVIVHD